MPDVIMRLYQPGDAAKLQVAERDPFDGFADYLEANAQGLLSYEIAGELIAVSGFTECWPGVADAVALVDREKAAGSGPQLARAFRQMIPEVMELYGIHRSQATSEPADRASRVFLRSIGYVYESTMVAAAPDGSDLLMFALIRRTP